MNGLRLATNKRTIYSMLAVPRFDDQQGIWGHGAMPAPPRMYTTTWLSVIVTDVWGFVA